MRFSSMETLQSSDSARLHVRTVLIRSALIGLIINRIYRSSMKTEKSQPEGQRIMPETRFTEFPALSVDQRVGTSRSASKTDD